MTFKSVREKKYILKLIAKSYKNVHNPPKMKKVICSLIRPKISLIFFLIFIPEYRKIALCVITLLKKKPKLMRKITMNCFFPGLGYYILTKSDHGKH